MKNFVLAAAAAALLAGCAGDYRRVTPGESEPGTPGPVPSVNFTSFSAVEGPAKVRMEGMSQESTYTRTTEPAVPGGEDEEGVPARTYISAVSGPTPAGPATVEITYDEDGKATDLALAGTHTTHGWSSLEDGQYHIRGAGGGATLVAAKPTGPGVDFDYQTFGVWVTGEAPQTAGRIGSFSVGAATAGADVQQSGTASFRGRSHGVHVSADGDKHFADADALMVADFAARSASLTTSGTILSDAKGAGVRAESGLDVTAGTLSWGEGSGQMSGTFSTRNGLAGDVQGAFYGPGAAEAGGLFSGTGAGATYQGAFGVRRE